MTTLGLNSVVYWPEELFSDPYEVLQFIELNCHLPVSLSELWRDFEKSRTFPGDELSCEQLRILMDQSLFFGSFDAEDPLYFPACFLFEGKSFSISPTKIEIENRLLMIEERFFPYIDPDVFSSEISVLWNNCEISLARFEFLGNSSEQIEHLIGYRRSYSENLNERMGFEDFITITSLDMEEFFVKTDFQPGDEILFTVNSYFDSRLHMRVLKKRELLTLKKEKNGIRRQICDYVVKNFKKKGSPETPAKLLFNALSKLYANEKFPQGILPCRGEYFLLDPRLKSHFFFGDLYLVPKNKSPEDSAREILQREKEKQTLFFENLNELANYYCSACNEDYLQLKLLVDEAEQKIKKNDTENQLKYASQILATEFPESQIDTKKSKALLGIIREEIATWNGNKQRISKDILTDIKNILKIYDRILRIFFRFIENPETKLADEKFLNLNSLKINLEDAMLIFLSNPQNEERIQDLTEELVIISEFVLKDLVLLK